MKLIKIFALTLLLFSPSVFAEPYTAVLSCGMQSRHLNIFACFGDTELKVIKNGNVRLYKVYELNSAGTQMSDGLHINLPNNFTVKAQNSDRNLVLGIKIFDQNGNVVFTDQVGKWGVINVGN